jgi:adenine deaminase
MPHPFDEALIDVAMGKSPADLVLTGGRLVNVYTGEIYEAGIAVVNGRVHSRGAETRRSADGWQWR